MKNNKRILITECSGECRNFRVVTKDSFFDDCDLEEGYYCAAYLHGGWQKIDPKECKNCTREKYFTGEKREELIKRAAKILCKWDTETNDCGECCCYGKNTCDLILAEEGYNARAEAVLNAFLEGKK